MNDLHRIIIDPEEYGGRPVIGGKHVRAAGVFEYPEADATRDDLQSIIRNSNQRLSLRYKAC